jgi:hypothetical protein
MSIWLEFNLDSTVATDKHISVATVIKNYCIQWECESPIIKELSCRTTNDSLRNQTFKIAIPNLDSVHALEFLKGLDTTFRKLKITYVIEIERLSIST